MKRACFKSFNLLGDGLCATLVMKKWHELNPDWAVDVLTSKDYVTPIYHGMGFPAQVLFSTLRDYDYKFEFKVGEAGAMCDANKNHVSENFAKLMGIDLNLEKVKVPNIGEFSAICPYYEPYPEPIEEEYKNLILISPFSRSCTSQERDENGKLKGKPPNKMLPWSTWQPIMSYLRTLGYPIRMLGAPDDRAPELKLSQEEYLTGVPINKLALIMREAKLLLSVDNGMGHLAASQSMPYILFYPACLAPYFIAPWGCQTMALLHIDPVQVSPAMLASAIRKMTTHLLGLGTAAERLKKKGLD